MKKLLFTLCLSTILAAPVWASEQAVDSDDLRSPDQVSDKNSDVKVPGEADLPEIRPYDSHVLCEGGACPKR